MKTIKLKYLDILNAHSALSRFLDKELDGDISMTLAYTFLALEEKVNEFDQKKVEIVKKYSEKDQNGEIVYLDSEKTRTKLTDEKAANKELNEYTMSETTIEISEDELLTLEQFKKIKSDTLGVKASDFIKLKAFFTACQS